MAPGIGRSASRADLNPPALVASGGGQPTTRREIDLSYSIEWQDEPPEDVMVDLGGGMVVPLSELVESAEEAERDRVHRDRA